MFELKFWFWIAYLSLFEKDFIKGLEADQIIAAMSKMAKNMKDVT